MPDALTVHHATHTYRDGFKALDNLSLTVETGDFFALLGHNGAGKTTLISAVAGLLKLTSGDIWVAGHHVQRDSKQARLHLGVVPQELVFDPFFSVRETLRIQSGYFGIRRNDDWIDNLLHHLDLTDKANTNTRNLSGGMKRRLMVAQALVHRPPVIILDEPTAGVDVALRQSLWSFMQHLNRQGHTIILTTHYLEEAEQYCRRIAVMKHGRLIALDSTAALLSNQQNARLHLQLGDRLPEDLRSLCIAESSGHNYILAIENHPHAAQIIARLHHHNIPIHHIRLPEKDLEQVFLGLTESEQNPS